MLGEAYLYMYLLKAEIYATENIDVIIKSGL